MYKGGAPYGSGIKPVSALPRAEDASADMQYFVTGGDEAGIYVLNAARDGYANVTVTRKYVNEKVAELFDGVYYDGETGGLVFTRANGEDAVVNLPKDNFLSDAAFDAQTHVLALTLSNGAVVEVPLDELLDVYTGDTTDTVAVSVSGGGGITADVRISGEDGNALEALSDGLYVKTTPIAAVLDEDATHEQAASARLMYELLSALAWKETA